MRFLYIDIDTLRADHVGCYGYHRNTTPNIDATASQGVRFKNVYASDVPCLPSRTALITGTFGIRNGVADHAGTAADLRTDGPQRSFSSVAASTSWASTFYHAGWHTASLSSFPFRHSASWWNFGFMEAMNLTRGAGDERADEVMPAAIDWLRRRGTMDDWLLHVHLWDPHTPYRTPESYGNPFAGDPPPAWHTEEVRLHNWDLAGPMSAQEPWGFWPDEWGDPLPRMPWNLQTMDDVKQLFDGYDVGIRYADDAVGILVNTLADLGVLDDTAILISSDHGEGMGELGVYADHHAADEATSHIPSILKWPGLTPSDDQGLHYHLDVAATIVDLAGIEVPSNWDGQSFATSLRNGADTGREYVVTSQGAWACQRGVRFGDHLYLRTFHDGYHPQWQPEMLFNVTDDPHEQHDLAGDGVDTLAKGRTILERWTEEQVEKSRIKIDPLQQVQDEGGPSHVRGSLPTYLERLRQTDRSVWADVLVERHPSEAASEIGSIPLGSWADGLTDPPSDQ